MSNRAKDFFRYLPVSERDRQWGLYVDRGRLRDRCAGHPRYPSSKHPRRLSHYSWSKGRVLAEYQVLYITRGEGEFESKPTGSAERARPAA